MLLLISNESFKYPSLFFSNMAIETIIGDLRSYRELVPGTFLCVDQLLAERLTTPELWDQWFYTAEGHRYFPRSDGGVDWVITRESDNLVLRHLYDTQNSSYDQLLQRGNFCPDRAEAEAARSAEDSVVVDMSQLRLSGNDQEYRFLAFRTSDGHVRYRKGFADPRDEELAVMNRLGYTVEYLGLLSDSGITETRIYVLGPEYVRTTVAGISGSNSLWRASWLRAFDYGSGFLAINRDVDSHNRLRGVRASEASSAPEGAPRNMRL